MVNLMPTFAKGANVFHAGQALPEIDSNINPILYELGADGDSRWQTQTPAINSEDDRDDIPWSHSPSPVLLPEVIPATHKHGYSSVSTPSSIDTASKRAKRDISRSVALQELTKELSNFSMSFLEGIFATTPSIQLLTPSPSWKTKAIQRVQDIEEELTDSELATLICIFQDDVNSANAYMAIKQDGIRREWIAAALLSV